MEGESYEDFIKRRREENREVMKHLGICKLGILKVPDSEELSDSRCVKSIEGQHNCRSYQRPYGEMTEKKWCSDNNSTLVKQNTDLRKTKVIPNIGSGENDGLIRLKKNFFQEKFKQDKRFNSHRSDAHNCSNTKRIKVRICNNNLRSLQAQNDIGSTYQASVDEPGSIKTEVNPKEKLKRERSFNSRRSDARNCSNKKRIKVYIVESKQKNSDLNKQGNESSEIELPHKEDIAGNDS